MIMSGERIVMRTFNLAIDLIVALYLLLNKGVIAAFRKK